MGGGVRALMRRKQVDSERTRAAGSAHQLRKELSVTQLVAIGQEHLSSLTFHVLFLLLLLLLLLFIIFSLRLGWLANFGGSLRRILSDPRKVQASLCSFSLGRRCFSCFLSAVAAKQMPLHDLI